MAGYIGTMFLDINERLSQHQFEQYLIDKYQPIELKRKIDKIYGR